MIDINNTLDLVKLKFYNEWLYIAHIYEEGDSQMHTDLTKTVVEKYIDPLALFLRLNERTGLYRSYRSNTKPRRC